MDKKPRRIAPWVKRAMEITKHLPDNWIFRNAVTELEKSVHDSKEYYR